MVKKKRGEGVTLQPPSGGGRLFHDEKTAEVKAPPQLTTTPRSTSGKSNDEDVTCETSLDATLKRDNNDIGDLSERLGNVSIATRQTSKEVTAPEAIRNLAALLSSNRCKNIVVLTGAGVSCSAGIPDFRTPGTGLYDNLQKYDLPFPEAVFDLGFFKRNPEPFVQLASELWPGLRHSPTITHSFIALLDRKGRLLRTYTQNIDMLDVIAGVSEEKMIECHGHFRASSCTTCSLPFDGEECKRIIVEEKRAPTCEHCGGYVKPNVVFFGEALPSRFHRLVEQDTKKADLLIVMGTSLLVGPVNMIPEIVRKDCPRVLLNRELVGTFCRRNRTITRRGSYSTISQQDIFHGGDCDASIRMLSKLLGWDQELEELNASTHLG